MHIIEHRELAPGLTESVKSLCGQLYTTMPDITDSSLRGMLGSDNSRLLVLYDQHGNALGMLSVGVYIAPGGARAWIEDVVVDSSHRGHGYGRMLLEKGIEAARSMGATSLALTSNPARIAANAMYLAAGFELYHTNCYKMIL